MPFRQPPPQQVLPKFLRVLDIAEQDFDRWAARKYRASDFSTMWNASPRPILVSASNRASQDGILAAMVRMVWNSGELGICSPCRK